MCSLLLVCLQTSWKGEAETGVEEVKFSKELRRQNSAGDTRKAIFCPTPGIPEGTS